ncbi:MAG: hypothetical protein QW096_02855 [Thermofilaceae archaeon]
MALTVCVKAFGDVDLELNVKPDIPYIIEIINLKTSPVKTLSFNLSKFVKYIVYSAALSDEEVVKGNCENGIISFQFKMAHEEFKIAFVLHTVNKTDTSSQITIPLPLAPLEQGSNFTLLIYELPSDPVINNPYLNFSKGFDSALGYYLRYNGSAPSGSLYPIELEVRYSNPRPVIDSIVRTVKIEKEQVIFTDNYTLVGFFDQESSNLELFYPGNFIISSVIGLMGVYPSTSYSVDSLNNSLKLSVKLMAPPRRSGDRAYLTVTLKTPYKCSENGCELPLSVAVGHYVNNLTVMLRVHGELEFQGLKPINLKSVQSDTVYILGSFNLLNNEFSNIKVWVKPKLATKLSPLYTVTLLLVAVIALYIGFTKTKNIFSAKQPASTKVVEKVAPPQEVVDTVIDIITLLRNWLDECLKLSEGKITMRDYKQIVKENRRKYDSLRFKIEKISMELADDNMKSLIKNLNEKSYSLVKIFQQFENLRMIYDRRTITRKEYERQIAPLKENAQDILDSLESLLKALT